MYPSTACTHLQQCPSYSNRKCKKTSTFSRTAAHILVSPWDAPAIITQYVARMKRQFNVCQTPRSKHLSIFNSFRVIRWLSPCVSPKIVIFMYRNRHFCFPWRRPCDYQAVCCINGKAIQCLPNSSQHVLINLKWGVIRCLSQCVSPKIANFTIFLFPLGYPLGQ